MRSADDIVERVREATNIIDVVSQYVQLRKRGRNFLGLCPFHNEKTPSFNVLEDKGIFKCFGCGQAGDVFSFLMKMEGLSFPEAIEKLAGAANIPYERRFKENSKDEEHGLENLYVACREYAAYCFKSLRSEAGEGAEHYLESRSLSNEILYKYGIGFAPEGSYFVKSIIQKNLNVEYYVKAGIIAKGNSGSYYERFRGRVIFPVFSPTGKIIAFGGRILPNTFKETAKYINSPETEIYNKSRTLYGLYQAKDHIRKSDFVVLVEGYADVLGLAQSGFQNVVAASGTSLTSDQLNIVRRFTRNIVLLFDSDTAGENAVIRGVELALVAGFDVSTILLPKGEDPDSFIRNHGKNEFQKKLDQREPFINALTKLLAERGAFDSLSSASKFVTSLDNLIDKIPDQIYRQLNRDSAYKIITDRIEAKHPSANQSEFKKLLQKNSFAREKSIEKAAKKPTALNPRVSKAKTVELTLLKTFLENTSISYPALIELDFDFSLIENELVKTIIMQSIRHFEETGISMTSAEVIEYFRDDEQIEKLIADVIIEADRLSKEWKVREIDAEHLIRQVARQSAALISIDALSKKIRELQRQLSSIESEKQENTLKKLSDYNYTIKILKEEVIATSS